VVSDHETVSHLPVGATVSLQPRNRADGHKHQREGTSADWHCQNEETPRARTNERGEEDPLSGEHWSTQGRDSLSLCSEARACVCAGQRDDVCVAKQERTSRAPHTAFLAACDRDNARRLTHNKVTVAQHTGQTSTTM
jgi:hypothetical protein